MGKTVRIASTARRAAVPEPEFSRNNGLDSAFRISALRHDERAGDAGKFAVPTLRNVAVTAPYMHDGRLSDAGRGRGALLHRHETQRDARPEPRQAFPKAACR